MSRRLPPLNALRAFEAAARLSSFRKAAEELHVTPAAISHQIKGLEGHLGVLLFRRSTRRLFLTERGQLALAYFRDGFDQLARGVEALRSRGEKGVLTVSTAPSFAAKWLVPRLGDFSARYPDIDLRLAATTGLADFDRDAVDVAIRFGRGVYEGLASCRLFGEVLTPLMSPALLTRKKMTVADLARMPLLHDDSVAMTGRHPGWREWFRRAGVEGVNLARGPHFDDAHLVLQAAAEGRGVALGRMALAQPDLRAGSLVAPFDLRITLDVGYHLVVPEVRVHQPMIAAFREWVMSTARGFDRELQAVIAPQST